MNSKHIMTTCSIKEFITVMYLVYVRHCSTMLNILANLMSEERNEQVMT